MTLTGDVLTPAFSSTRPHARWFAAIRRLPLLPTVILGLVVISAVFGPWLAPHDPDAPDVMRRLQPPAWSDGGDWSHPLGTDPIGRDILSRIIVGARVSALIAVTVVVISGSIGTLVALVSGYFQGWIDAVLMRITDAVISIPFLVLAVAVAGLVGQSLTNLILILGLLSWSSYARVLRSEVLKIKHSDYVTLARITGVPTPRIMAVHVFPNLVNTLVVLATLQLGVAVLAAASLGFLGLGVPPPTAEWGAMLSEGRLYISSAWWVATIPGIAISGMVMSVNILGDWLRSRLDPKLRGI